MTMKMMIKMIRYLCTDDDDDHNDSLKLEKLGVLLSTRVTTGRHSSVFCVCCWYRVVESIVLLSNNSLIVLSYNKLWHFALSIKNGHILPTGQWNAPSAVIKCAWYCMVLHGVAWY